MSKNETVTKADYDHMWDGLKNLADTLSGLEAEAGRLRTENIKLENTLKEVDKGMAEEMAKGKPPKPKFVLQSNPRDGLVFPEPLKGLVKELDKLKEERDELKEENKKLADISFKYRMAMGTINIVSKERDELKKELADNWKWASKGTIRSLEKDIEKLKKELAELRDGTIIINCANCEHGMSNNHTIYCDGCISYNNHSKHC